MKGSDAKKKKKKSKEITSGGSFPSKNFNTTPPSPTVHSNPIKTNCSLKNSAIGIRSYRPFVPTPICHRSLRRTLLLRLRFRPVKPSRQAALEARKNRQSSSWQSQYPKSSMRVEKRVYESNGPPATSSFESDIFTFKLRYCCSFPASNLVIVTVDFWR